MALSNQTGASERTLRVVAIGGGTGLSTLLRGLKGYVTTPERRKGVRLDPTARIDAPPPAPCPAPRCVIRELSAVVTVTDDGGSSGRLREDFKMLPPGDIRNCMVALSEDEHLLSKLFQFRFEQGELEGHSFGNLFVAALSSHHGRLCAGGTDVVADPGDTGKDLSRDEYQCDSRSADGRWIARKRRDQYHCK